MKFLIIFTLITISSISFASEHELSKEGSKELYILNKQVMNEKEIISKPDICKWQNELAERSNMPKYNCLETNRRNEVDDTSKGDKMVRKTLEEVNKFNKIQGMFNKEEVKDRSIGDLDYVIKKYY